MTARTPPLRLTAPGRLPILRPIRRWYCPNCGKESVSVSTARPGEAETKFHDCPKLRGLMAPMLPAGTRAKVEAVEHQDYIGNELVQRDPERRRPIQSVVTTRDNGQDAIVYAPTARIGLRSD